jgi:hypothetical protein
MNSSMEIYGRRSDEGGIPSASPPLLFRTIHDVALMIDRERSGRAYEPVSGSTNVPY